MVENGIRRAAITDGEINALATGGQALHFHRESVSLRGMRESQQFSEGRGIAHTPAVVKPFEVEF